VALLALLLAVLAAGAARAAELGPLVDKLAQGGFAGTEAAVNALAATGDPAVAPVLEALGEGDLYSRKSDGKVVIGRKQGSAIAISDPLTGETLGELAASALSKIKVNNPLRRVIKAALGGLTLTSADPATRLAAANEVFKSHDAAALEGVEAAIAAETDPAIRRAFEAARAAILLTGEGGEAGRLAAVDVIRQRGGQDAVALLGAVAGGEGSVAEAARAALAAIEADLAWWGTLQNVVYGVSLGSVLLLAAIGLAITFGVMGVINMAHGEMVMLGAYTTFVVQDLIRSAAPNLFDYSLLIALPLAFLVAAAVGVAIERSVIRWLYGRPLETLLATWGLSLVLQQAVRSIFGASNREVGNPSWMSGSFDLGQISLTYGRLWIVVFSLVVFAALILLLRRTPLGLQMRAVTQNRAMAASMGIRTPWIDALTFGLGSGIAGLGGVALSQIDNVSPNLGQGYIVDSFMIVIFGGVGNLWGTLVGATSLGIVNKFLEPYAGAVLGKILVLVLIILFIQVRPRGLFALKGRAVES
jgi:urea transport system permease protein